MVIALNTFLRVAHPERGLAQLWVLHLLNPLAPRTFGSLYGGLREEATLWHFCLDLLVAPGAVYLAWHQVEVGLRAAQFLSLLGCQLLEFALRLRPRQIETLFERSVDGVLHAFDHVPLGDGDSLVGGEAGRLRLLEHHRLLELLDFFEGLIFELTPKLFEIAKAYLGSGTDVYRVLPCVPVISR